MQVHLQFDQIQKSNRSRLGVTKLDKGLIDLLKPFKRFCILAFQETKISHRIARLRVRYLQSRFLVDGCSVQIESLCLLQVVEVGKNIGAVKINDCKRHTAVTGKNPAGLVIILESAIVAVPAMIDVAHVRQHLGFVGFELVIAEIAQRLLAGGDRSIVFSEIHQDFYQPFAQARGR